MRARTERASRARRRRLATSRWCAASAFAARHTLPRAYARRAFAADRRPALNGVCLLDLGDRAQHRRARLGFAASAAGDGQPEGGDEPDGDGAHALSQHAFACPVNT